MTISSSVTSVKFTQYPTEEMDGHVLFSVMFVIGDRSGLTVTCRIIYSHCVYVRYVVHQKSIYYACLLSLLCVFPGNMTKTWVNTERYWKDYSGSCVSGRARLTLQDPREVKWCSMCCLQVNFPSVKSTYNVCISLTNCMHTVVLYPKWGKLWNHKSKTKDFRN